MIDDPELRALFKAESEEHLQTLENGLLRLEAEPRDAAAMLEELFRSAHSLKGAARMLGVEGVETLAHHFEDELGAAKRGHSVISSAMADRLYRGVDAMRKLAREASDGEAAQVDIPQVLAQLRGDGLPPAPAPEVMVVALTPLAKEPGSGETGYLGDGAEQLPAEITSDEAKAGPLRLPVVLQMENVPAPQKPPRNGATLEPNGAALRAAIALPPTRETSNDKPAIAVEEPPIAAKEPSDVSELPAVGREPFDVVSNALAVNGRGARVAGSVQD